MSLLGESPRRVLVWVGELLSFQALTFGIGLRPDDNRCSHYCNLRIQDVVPHNAGRDNGGLQVCMVKFGSTDE